MPALFSELRIHGFKEYKRGSFIRPTQNRNTQIIGKSGNMSLFRFDSENMDGKKRRFFYFTSEKLKRNIDFFCYFCGF